MTDICNRLYKFSFIVVGHVHECSVPFSLELCCCSLKLIQGAESFLKTNRPFTSQEIPRILRNPKVHERVLNNLQPVSILSQSEPTHVLLSYSLKMNFNIILSSTYRSFKLHHSFMFPCNLTIKFTVMYWFQCVANTANIASVTREPKGRDPLISYCAKTAIGNLWSSKLVRSKILKHF